MSVKQFDQLGKVGQRPGQTIDLVDNNDIEPSGTDIIEQSLQVRAIGGPTGISAVVVPRSNQRPASMRLTLYVGRGSVVLGIKRVELLVQPLIGGDAGVDRAADRFDHRS